MELNPPSGPTCAESAAVPVAKAGATIYRESLIDALGINRNQHDAAIDNAISAALQELATQPEPATR